MFLMIFRKRQILSRFVNFCQLYFLATLGYSSSSNSSILIRIVVVNWTMFLQISLAIMGLTLTPSSFKFSVYQLLHF